MDTGSFQNKYKVYDFKWGYILGSYQTLRAAKAWIASKGMRCDHKRGELNLYAAY